MSLEQKEFFHIESSQLKRGENAIYPFHLYIYNQASSQYSTLLFANSPFTQEKQDLVEFILERGGELAIDHAQKLTFLKDQSLDESDIVSLQVTPEHEFISRQRKRQNDLEERQKKKGNFLFRQELAEAAADDNYLPLIDQVRSEALAFHYTVSHTVSLASFLSEKLLFEDNFINRIVAVSFHLAKGCGMDDQGALGDLIVAAFLSHIGHTQMDLIYSQKAQLEQTGSQKREYKKHPGLAQHLIRKSGLVISERCNRVLYQHHERFDGGGYPEYKQGPFIEPLALVLGASAHILEYTSGKVTGTPVPMITVVKNLKEKYLTPGLELEFGDTIYESLIYLLEENNDKGVGDKVSQENSIEKAA
jgi:HD-GYP domain-containing protein (c-di-GMP phosphodiesterase class II)